MIHDVNYFIDKFEAIPESRWTECYFSENGKHCANGHCGILSSNERNEESIRLKEVFKNLPITAAAGDRLWEPSFQHGFSLVAANINDGRTAEYQQPTPKQRILAALYDIKAMQSKDGNDKGSNQKTVYVAVPVTISEQAKELVMS